MKVVVAMIAAAYVILIIIMQSDGVRLGRKWGRMRLCDNLEMLQGSTSTGDNFFRNVYNSLLSWIGLQPGKYELKKSSLWVLEMNKRGGGEKEVSFTDEFERIHGNVHPVVRATSLVEALELARRRNKLLLVYISPRVNQAGRSTAKEVHKVVCNALADEGIAQFIDESFVFWAALGDSSNTASAARRLGAKRYPFFGVVHSSVLTEKSFTVGLHHLNPAPSPDAMMRWMTRILKMNAHLLEKDAKEIQRLETDATIARDRRSGYNQAVLDDALNIKLQESAARALSLKEDTLKAEEQARNAETERRMKLLTSIKMEPEPTGPDCVEVQLMLGHGVKHRRRFSKERYMNAIFQWADALGVDISRQAFGTRASKSIFAHPQDSSTQIKSTDLGRCQRSTIYLVKQPPTPLEEHSMPP